MEARVNPWLPDTAPRLRWVVESEGWLALGFDHVEGRHPDLTPGSDDLPAIADALTGLSQGLTPCPPVRVQPATVRWRNRIAPDLIDGQTLCHTDVTPLNFLVGPGVVRLVDWSMPIRGAAWIDAALMIVRLIRAGHTPAQAESWADRIPPWKQASPEAVGVFVSALAALWEQRLREYPVPHRRQLAEAAQAWAASASTMRPLAEAWAWPSAWPLFDGDEFGICQHVHSGRRIGAVGLLVSRRRRPQSHHRVRRQHDRCRAGRHRPPVSRTEGLRRLR